MERFVLHWPEEILLLVPPGRNIYGQSPRAGIDFHRMATRIAPRAFGFSPTGKTLLLATSSDITIWSRP